MNTSQLLDSPKMVKPIPCMQVSRKFAPSSGKQGKITDLGTLPEGGYESEANAVNSAGQVGGVGLNTIPFVQPH